MRQHVRDLSLRQPETNADHQCQGEEKSEGKGIGHSAVRESEFGKNRTDYMAQDANNLVWLDMEMTGLEPERERIIELAMIVTDSNLETIAESPVWVVHQSDAQLDAMDDWNKKTHGGTGLIERVRASSLDEAAVEAAALAFVREYVPERTSPMCGNSIGQDRRFMVRYMPLLEAWFHYRSIDVSTLKELCRRWKPDLAKGFVKKSDHTALTDIRESINELKYYREHFIKL
jgi:oligoribonuclease